ncbi:MAG: 2-oxo acid dehydrogenase subunit E2, partial [Caulobacterales bacterium]|nr:2-oxo acid dehydrogenase subunit E2 [Caulobacterales bacterium]
EWFAEEGRTMASGDLLVLIETDKIANEVELEFDGTLRKRIGDTGDAYPVGALIAVFADADVPPADIDRFIAEFKPADAGFAHAGEAPSAGGSAPAPSPAPIPANLSISPKAAELAASLGVDLSQVEGSGRNGRISLQDVEQAARAQGLAPTTGEPGDNPHKVVKLSSMRRTIAKRLTEANQSVPHFYLRNTVAMDALLARREAVKAGGAGAPSINDYLIKACAQALMSVPEVNAQFHGDAIHQFEHADISVAVAVPDGLITPIVRRADEKSLAEIAEEMRQLSAAAREAKLAPEQYQGGTFSLSNLGMYGVTSFDAVVNPPMAAILAAGAVGRAAKEEGGFESVMQLTLSCDHRAVDGALGGRFLQALKAALETPEQL